MKTPRKVLLVDDDPASLAMLGLALRQGGMRVTKAHGGPEALEHLARSRFDWLVTDAAMSPVDGYELARRAKRLDPSLRILMVTAVANEAALAGTPIEKIFHKPFAAETLVAWLQAVVKPGSPPPQGGAPSWRNP